MRQYLQYFFLVLFVILPFTAEGQIILPPDADSTRLARVEQLLRLASATDNSYNEKIDITAAGMSLSDILRNVAEVNEVNLSLRNLDNIIVSCSFTDARIIDIISFLCKEYRLDADLTGNILTLRSAAPIPNPASEPRILFHISNNSMDMDLAGDRAIEVVRKINRLTGINIILPETIYSRPLSAFARNMPVQQSIHTLAELNGLSAERDRTGTWYFYENQTGTDNRNYRTYNRRRHTEEGHLSVDSLGYITARLHGVEVRELIEDMCEETGRNYHFLSPVYYQTSVFVNGATFEQLLDVVLSGSEYTYYKIDGVYMFGTFHSNQNMNGVEVIPLHYRSVSKLTEVIPGNLKDELQITVSEELNSIIASGDQRLISRLRSFLESVDKRVPLITIEVIIVDVTKSANMDVGLDMGLGKAPAATGGTVSPGVDLSLGASSINSLLNSFNGFGSINLGKVSPQFYVNLKLMEDNGDINVRSTPKLSTLNGHEATMKSGERRYYKEVINTYMGSQNPIQSEAYTWRDVEANLSITITPFVSHDRQVTLEIEIEQSEFTERVESEGPPGTATRSFKSLIRVEDQDMVLLGGIERNSSNKTSKGLPFIARVPVLRWIFGRHSNNKTDQKLNVFIKPTVID